MTCGVYKIVNKVNGKFYIGSSVDIERRFKHHIRNLKLLKHHCDHLSKSFAKHGEEAFYLVILEVCNREERVQKEQEYLDIFFDRDKCYNTSRSAKGFDSDFVAKINRKRFESEENRIKQSESVKRAWSDPDNPMRSSVMKYLSDPTFKAKQSERSKLRWQDIEYREHLTQCSKVNAKKQWETMRDKMISSINNPETAAKKSASAKELWQDSEFREKMMNRTRPTEETKLKLSKIFKELHGSPESRHRKMLECPHREEVVCVETGTRYNSISELARSLNLNCSRKLRKALKANRPFKGIMYKYVKDLKNED